MKVMKQAVRMLILVAGLACAFEALAAQIVPAPDGEPPALCNPHRPCPHWPTRRPAIKAQCGAA